VGPSVRKEEDEVGFSLKFGDSVIGLDALSVNDRTLWTTKLTEAITSFEETEKKFLTKQKSGELTISFLLPSKKPNIPSNIRVNLDPHCAVRESETKESQGRLLLIVLKGEHIQEQSGKD
jgi:hypothetical protein